MTAKFVYFLTLNLAALVICGTSHAESASLWKNKAGLNVAAAYMEGMKGPSIESLYFDSTTRLADDISLQFRIDPFYSGSSIRQPLKPFTEPQSNSRFMLSQFSLTKQLHGPWHLRFSQADGTLSPFHSPFSLADAFSDEPFAQSTISLLFQDNTTTLTVSVGNGEGEVIGIDPELYYGARWLYRSAIGFIAAAGWSFDGNNLASEEAKRKGIAYTKGKLGFNTERYYAAIGLDGSWEKALGLKTSLIYQKTALKDQDSAYAAFPPVSFSSDWRDLIVEDPTGKIQNQLQRERWAFHTSYLILARFDMGLGVQRLSMTSDVPLGTNARKNAAATITTWGFGALMQESLRLSIEQYHWNSGDKASTMNGMSGNSVSFFLLKASASIM